MTPILYRQYLSCSYQHKQIIYSIQCWSTTLNHFNLLSQSYRIGVSNLITYVLYLSLPYWKCRFVLYYHSFANKQFHKGYQDRHTIQFFLWLMSFRKGNSSRLLCPSSIANGRIPGVRGSNLKLSMVSKNLLK